MKKIAIHSAPRSGSTWLGAIFDSCPNVAYRFQPLFSYGHKSQLGADSTLDEINRFFEDILNSKDEFVLQKKEKEDGTRPVFEKKETSAIVYKEVRYHHILENLMEKDNEVFVIGLVRNPLSVINSWLKAPKEFRKDLGWEELKEWRFALKKNLEIEEFNGFEKWKEVTKIFEGLKRKYPDRFFLLKYDDLLNDTTKIVEKLFDFCGIDYTNQTENFILKSSTTNQSTYAYSVYRKEQTDEKWKKQLNPIIISEIKEELLGTRYEKYI